MSKTPCLQCCPSDSLSTDIGINTSCIFQPYFWNQTISLHPALPTQSSTRHTMPSSLKISGRSQILHYKARVLQVFHSVWCMEKGISGIARQSSKGLRKLFPTFALSILILFSFSRNVHSKTKFRAATLSKNIWANQNFFLFLPPYPTV